MVVEKFSVTTCLNGQKRFSCHNMLQVFNGFFGLSVNCVAGEKKNWSISFPSISTFYQFFFWVLNFCIWQGDLPSTSQSQSNPKKGVDVVVVVVAAVAAESSITVERDWWWKNGEKEKNYTTAKIFTSKKFYWVQKVADNGEKSFECQNLIEIVNVTCEVSKAMEKMVHMKANVMTRLKYPYTSTWLYLGSMGGGSICWSTSSKYVDPLGWSTYGAILQS